MQEEEAVVMDIGNFRGILSKLDNDNLGKIAGFVLTQMQYDKTRGYGWFGNLQAEIAAAMRDPHFPNLEHVMMDLTSDAWAGKIFKGSLQAGVIGWILHEADLHPDLTRIGKILKTLGFNAAIGAAGVAVLDNCTVSHSPAGVGESRPSNSYVRGL